MDDAGIDGSTSESDDDKPCEGESIYRCEEEQQEAEGGDALPQANHLAIIQQEGDETTDSTSTCNAEIEKGSVTCSGDRIDTAEVGQIGTCPEACCLLQCAVSEESYHDFFCTPERENLTEGECMRGRIRILCVSVRNKSLLLPEGK